ncbi:hypothetical protein GQ53DRAFT_722399 [Thozetella sp. PMI_491]|nr:hypothetical protein GQ53DRAFT_722399 [Thozetella sp. PMI_491]
MASANENQPRARPKACDLCFTKKIKCDMLMPECSNCVLYHTKCRISVARSRARPPRPRPAGVNKREALGVSKPSESIQGRIHMLEGKLQEILESTRMVQGSASASVATEIGSTSESLSSARTAEKQKWGFNPVRPSLYYGPSDGDPFLPPLEDIMPTIDVYFETFNLAFPLFNQTTFMGLVTSWYGRNPKRSKVIWANVLVVIALGLQSHASNEPCPSHQKHGDWLGYCIRNAQSAMPELVLRDEDLLGIQAILALALIFKHACDLRPARVLVASAVTLSHRMHLHLRDAVQYYSPKETQQRSRVFWVLYMLDKDLSIRTKTPPMLFDSEIDLNLPLNVSPDTTGVICTTNGRYEMNIFSLRLDLACIQGKIYNLLYSSRSRKIQKQEGEKRINSLQMMLDSWYARIPAAFQIRDVTSTVSDVNLVQMTNLYHTYLLCHFWIHGIYSYKAEWLQKASSLSRAALHDFAVAVQGQGFSPCRQISHAPRVNGWQRCVDISRDSMPLFQATKLTESMIWQSGGPHLSALVILLANILISPGQPSAAIDLGVVTESIQFLDRLMDVVQSSSYEPLSRVIKDLYKDASTVVGDIHAEEVDQIVGLDSLGDTRGELGLCVQDTECFGLESCEYQLIDDSAEFDEILDPYLGDFSLPSNKL